MTRLGAVLGGAVLTCIACLGFAACGGFAAEEAAPQAEAAANETTTGSDGGVDSPIVDAAVDTATMNCDTTHCRQPNERYVFVTTGSLTGDFAKDAGDAGALAAADQFCVMQANADSLHADLVGRHWRAWLCLPDQGAIGRIGLVQARWTRPDGTEVFATTDDLKIGETEAGIHPAGLRVWTGCSGSNGLGQPSSGTCRAWTVQTGDASIGTYGLSDGRTPTWSFSGPQACTNSAPLYCFESDVP